MRLLLPGRNRSHACPTFPSGEGHPEGGSRFLSGARNTCLEAFEHGPMAGNRYTARAAFPRIRFTEGEPWR